MATRRLPWAKIEMATWPLPPVLLTQVVRLVMKSGSEQMLQKVEELLEKFQTNHWPHMTSRVARMEGMLAVLIALTLAVATKTFIG